MRADMHAPRGPGLRALLAKGELIVAPGCYDVIGARLIEAAGFPAAYLTGSGVSLSATGLPDIGLANLVEGGRTPLLPQDELAAIGYRVAIYPNALTRAFARAGQDLLEEIKRTGTSAGMPPRMLTHGELWDLFGRREWNAQEPRFVRDVGIKQEP